MNEKRGPWYLLTGLCIGLITGLFYTTLIAPPRMIDVSPDVLSDGEKAEYRSLIALAYQADGDLGRAKARLAQLKDADMMDALTVQAQQVLAVEGPAEVSSALANLAEVLGKENVPPDQTKVPDLTATPAELSMLPSSTLQPGEIVRTATLAPTLTETLQATYTPYPTSTSLAALTMAFTMEGEQKVCDADLPTGLIQIQVEDKEGEPIPGARISITWDNGEEFFFTGLNPQIGLGYADYQMSSEKIYSLHVGEGGEVVEDLSIPVCKDGGGNYFRGGWKLRFTPI